MKLVGERYAYFYARVAELELKLKVAEAAMCEHCQKQYLENVKLPESEK